MAPKKHPPRRTQGVNPYLVDMTEIPQTPAITAVHEIAKLAFQVSQLHESLGELVIDGTELGLAEGQMQSHVIRAQGRPFSWRSQLTRILERDRGYDSSQPWRERTKDIRPEEIPSYLSPESVAAIREGVQALARVIADVEEARKREYPAVHARAKAAIEGVSAKAS